MVRLRLVSDRRVFLTAVILGLPACAGAQSLLTTVPAGARPTALVVNPITNQVYVANQDSSDVTILDGVTNHTSTVSVGASPVALAVNATTNQVYVVNQGGNSVSVIDGANNTTRTIAVGRYPDAVAVNPNTNKAYVTNRNGGTVTKIDGTGYSTSTLAVGRNPVAVAVNSVTNKIYVANSGSNSVSVIDGDRNSVTSVAVGRYPRSLAIDEITNQIYVANFNDNTVSVIDGQTNAVTSVNTGEGPAAVAVDAAADKIYTANYVDGTTTVIDGATLATTPVAIGSAPSSLVVDAVTNKVYFTNYLWTGTVTMLSGADHFTYTLFVGVYPTASAVNLQTNRIYVTNSGDNTISVIAGAASDPLQFLAITPCRLVDTRWPHGPFGGPPLARGESRSFAIPQGGCGLPDTAVAYSLNVTVVPPAGGRLGFLTIWPTGQARPLVSTLNSPDGRTKANAALVAAGAAGAVSVYVNDTTDIVIDINGYMARPADENLQFYPVAPCRLVDTRGAPGPLGGPFLNANEEREFPLATSACIPAGTTPVAFSLNVTAVPYPSGQRLGYLTVWPAGQGRPTVSTLNNPTATIVANAAIVPAGAAGAITAYASHTTHMLLDLNGYFAAPGQDGLAFHPSAPCRVLDTRDSGGAFSGQRNPPIDVIDSACGIPSTAQGYVVNATVVPRVRLGYLTLWPDTKSQPDTSNLNAIDGAITSNMAVISNFNGKIDAYAAGLTDLIIDISGYFAP